MSSSVSKAAQHTVESAVWLQHTAGFPLASFEFLALFFTFFIQLSGLRIFFLASCGILSVTKSSKFAS